MGPARSEPVAVRIRLQLLADGSTTRSPIVYCDPQKRTVPLARCAGCGFGGRVERDAGGAPRTVGCTRFVVPSSPPALVLEPSIAACGVQGIAASFSVGTVLLRDVLCVAEDVSLHTLSLARVDDASAATPVVDAQGRLLGVLPRNRTRLSRFASFADDAVTEHARGTPLVIEEDRPLADAFLTMAAHHARELTVLDADRRVVGVLGDVDALRYAAYVARMGLRPAPPAR